MQLQNPSNTTTRYRNSAIDRDQWHNPLASIVVTHYNYAEFLAEGLASLLDQTYEKWECVVVDDGSAPEHLVAVREIIDEIGSSKVRLLPLANNAGQIPAFYAGLDATKGEFVCLLDPDDRYAQTFLEEMVGAHLNPICYVPLISCDQHLMRDNQVITGVQTGHRAKIHFGDDWKGKEISEKLHWFSPDLPSWYWSTTSSMMFRRPVLNAMRPNKTLTYKRQVDAYLAPGAHMLGGSMFLLKPLVYRSLHSGNGWQREDVWGQHQGARLPVTRKCRDDVREAIIANGYEADLIRAQTARRTFTQRLRRSFRKRAAKLQMLLTSRRQPKD